MSQPSPPERINDKNSTGEELVEHATTGTVAARPARTFHRCAISHPPPHIGGYGSSLGDTEAGAVNVRLHHGDLQGAKLKAEVVADILAASGATRMKPNEFEISLPPCAKHPPSQNQIKAQGPLVINQDKRDGQAC